MKAWLGASLFSLLMAGCAGNVPKAIRESPPGPSVAEARAQQGPIGARVRWGGNIAKVENHATETWIEIVERSLESDGRPRQEDRSGGRFLARITGFLDPAVYAVGRQMTVAGMLTELITRPIGEFPYTFPAVKVEEYYLWPPLPERSAYPYHAPPWYDPWYPWRPYPYRRW